MAVCPAWHEVPRRAPALLEANVSEPAADCTASAQLVVMSVMTPDCALLTRCCR